MWFSISWAENQNLEDQITYCIAPSKILATSDHNDDIAAPVFQIKHYLGQLLISKKQFLPVQQILGDKRSFCNLLVVYWAFQQSQ